MPKYYDLDCRTKLKKLLKTILGCCKFHLVIKNNIRYALQFEYFTLKISEMCFIMRKKA